MSVQPTKQGAALKSSACTHPTEAKIFDLLRDFFPVAGNAPVKACESIRLLGPRHLPCCADD